MSDDHKLRVLTFPTKEPVAPKADRSEVLAEAAKHIAEFGCTGLMVIGLDGDGDPIFLSDGLPAERAVWILEIMKASLVAPMRIDIFEPE